VVDEQRQGERSVLDGAERSWELADDDGVGATSRVGHPVEQRRRFGSSPPRQGPGHVDVVHHLHDAAVAGDALLGSCPLPAERVGGGLGPGPVGDDGAADRCR
jgi:hypothetical protein